MIEFVDGGRLRVFVCYRVGGDYFDFCCVYFVFSVVWYCYLVCDCWCIVYDGKI